MNKLVPIVLTGEQLRSLQLKGVEILSHVIKAIEQMNLTYYCVGGTALGAKKYNGFIPWDDDIDIAMPRDDYMKFLLNGKKYLPNNLFISSCFTENGYFGGVAKVRDINTSYFDIETARFNICHGAFIDIFPIDGYKSLRKKDAFLKKICQGRIIFAQGRKKSFSVKIKGLISTVLCFFKSPNHCCKRIEKILSKHNIQDCEQVFNRIMVFEKSVFGMPRKGIFEGLEINLPAKLEDYLTICYGDYAKDIPDEKKIPHHFAYLIDLNTSYKNYSYSHGVVVKKL